MNNLPKKTKALMFPAKDEVLEITKPTRSNTFSMDIVKDERLKTIRRSKSQESITSDVQLIQRPLLKQ